MNNNTKEKMEHIANLIEHMEKDLQNLKEAYNELVETISPELEPVEDVVTGCTDDEDAVFEKVMLVYERYVTLRTMAKEQGIVMTQIGGLSALRRMYAACEKNYCNSSEYLSRLKLVWYHGCLREGRTEYPKPSRHEAFEKLPKFQQLLNTPTENITNSMLDSIILEDMQKAGGCSKYKWYDEFVALLETE